MGSSKKENGVEPMHRTPFSDEELEEFRELIEDKRRNAMDDIEQLRAQLADSREQAENDTAYSFHMADAGTDAMEREKAFLFASQEGRFLWHIDQALRRLYRDPENFGKCHSCGELIDFDRLDALPHARLCITCKQREEDAKKQ